MSNFENIYFPLHLKTTDAITELVTEGSMIKSPINLVFCDSLGLQQSPSCCNHVYSGECVGFTNNSINKINIYLYHINISSKDEDV